MRRDPGMASGPILAQTRLSIDPEDTTGSLTARLAYLGAELLLEKLPLWVEGKLTPQPQDEASATFSHRLTKEGGVLGVVGGARRPEGVGAEPGQVVAGPPQAGEAPWGVACGEGVLGLRRV